MKSLWPLAALVLFGLVGVAWWRVQPSGPVLNDSAVAEIREPQGAAYFRDVTDDSGIAFSYRNGQEADHYAILESVGGGVALLDYDGDGLLDIFLPGGGYFTGAGNKNIAGHPCKLYRNVGGFRFRDVTREAGLERAWFYSHGAAVADYDRDGWPDLLVTGYGHIALFHNEPAAGGGRQFVDVTTQAKLPQAIAWATSAAFADLDGDGYPDLYICQYVNWSFDNNPRCEGYTADIPRDVCPPRQFDALPHLLLRNNGDRTFSDVGKQAGLRAPRQDRDYDQLVHLDAAAKQRLREGDWEKDFGKGLGVLVVDVDGDGRPDLYVANDTTDKFLYLNRSRPGQVLLEERGRPLGVALDDLAAPNGSMGLDAGDYDGSGLPSLLVTNYENELHGLYRNVTSGGKLAFVYSSHAAGIGRLGRQFVGFGTGFLDVDADGWEDIIIANGHVIRHPTRSSVRQRPVLLRNQGRGAGKEASLVDASAQAGTYFATEHQGRGVAIGDLDNDGRPDLVVSHINAPVALLRNQAGADHHWLGIALTGKGQRDVVGARVRLEVDGRVLTRFAKGGGSYLSNADRRHLFGLGPHSKIGRVTVAWPSGQEQHWEGLAVDRYWQLKAGDAVPVLHWREVGLRQ